MVAPDSASPRALLRTAITSLPPGRAAGEGGQEWNLCRSHDFPEPPDASDAIGARRSRRFIVQTNLRFRIFSRVTPAPVEAA